MRASQYLLAALLCAAALACTPHMQMKQREFAKPLHRLGESDDVKAVRETFEAYERALFRRDGPAAAAQVSRSTIEYWAELRQLALYGAESEVRGQRLPTRMHVVMLRHRVSPGRLRAFEPADLFAHVVTRGWMGPTFGMGALEEIEVNGQRASAGSSSQWRIHPYEFVKEEGIWHLELRGELDAEETQLKALAYQRGMSEDELVVSLVERSSKVPVPDTVWQPLFAPPPGGASSTAGAGAGAH